MNKNSLFPQGARGPHKNPTVEKRRKIILKKVETTIGKKGAEDIERGSCIIILEFVAGYTFKCGDPKGIVAILQ